VRTIAAGGRSSSRQSTGGGEEGRAEDLIEVLAEAEAEVVAEAEAEVKAKVQVVRLEAAAQTEVALAATRALLTSTQTFRSHPQPLLPQPN
jgi:hypothetical protein